MAWSTRQVAELAGTTVKAVRHYHKVGLLDEPERGDNGYKHYGVAHLVRLLRIKRLADLGAPLSRIAALGDFDEHPEEAFRALDAELAVTIERLQRDRAELALILRQRAPIDLPPEFAPVTTHLSEADRSLMVVLARILGPTTLDAWREALRDLRRDPVIDQFDELPAGADERTRHDLAERLTPHAQAVLAKHPGLWDVGPDAPRDAKSVARIVGQAIADLYTPAQIDVLRRVNRLLRGPAEPDGNRPLGQPCRPVH
ncbi:MerR family transcriptional regulator [Streptomyces sp. 6N223]|uniref:MerR family transcriptional regulator n=1 Tax=Streptomyces sp. 6N223 TaxID=3457412 RepID=UPI003FD55D80